MEAHVPCFSSEVLKRVVDYRPMVLLVLYGEVSLRQLLRLRASYGWLEGLVVYD